MALLRPSYLKVEAIGFVEWFIDRFRPCVDKIDIADATELASRCGKRRKNDPNYAVTIARRLARGECPLAGIVDHQFMQLRKLGRQWRSLSHTLARAKRCMQSILLAANLCGPKFDGARTQEWPLADGRLLKEAQRAASGNFLDIVRLIERERESWRHKIIFANRKEPFEAVMTIIESAPGIDEIWRCIIAAKTGEFLCFPIADAMKF